MTAAPNVVFRHPHGSSLADEGRPRRVTEHSSAPQLRVFPEPKNNQEVNLSGASFSGHAAFSGYSLETERTLFPDLLRVTLNSPSPLAFQPQEEGGKAIPVVSKTDLMSVAAYTNLLGRLQLCADFSLLETTSPGRSIEDEVCGSMIEAAKSSFVDLFKGVANSRDPEKFLAESPLAKYKPFNPA